MYILLYIYTILFLSFLGSAFGTFINLILYYIFESVDVESTLSPLYPIQKTHF